MAKCPNQAFYRFTWPGRDESYICTEHVNWLKAIADRLGFHLQIIELSQLEQAQHTCNQELKEKKSNGMTFTDARDRCHVRSAIYRASKPDVKYWKNHSIPLDKQVPIEDQAASDWLEYDPRDSDEASLFAFND